MAIHFTSGAVIFRHWDHRSGLAEVSRPFTTLDELLDLCSHAGSDYLVERIVIDGQDSSGIKHTLRLAFQSSGQEAASDATPGSAAMPPEAP